MKLLIVESPAKAKTISKYLDGKYTVKASIGHVRDLPKSNRKAIDLEDGFKPYYEISKGKEKVVEEIKNLADKSDEILLATDPDREGEAIAWHVAETAGIKHPKRVVFHEITEEAVKEAILHPRDIDMNLKEAQEARRVLDRLFGYDLSGLIWKKVRYGLSAGRVQSPALRILMEREREIRAFKPETFWTITAEVENSKSDKFTVVCEEEPRDINVVEKILNEGKKEEWKVKDISETEAKRAPKPPFITYTLQQSASSRLGFLPARTMALAQKLYEAGHITYMRTDSTNLSSVAIEQIKNVVGKKFGNNLFTHHIFAKKSKNAQEAHEAIRPTHSNIESAGSTEEQKRLYKLIWQRTITSQMADAKILRTKVIVQVGAGNIPNFSINGSRVLSPGWLLADPSARGEDTEIPKLSIGEEIKLVEIKSSEKQTEPPSRYTEAGLIKELEKRGIGRPSTYATIMKTLEDRGYATKENRSLTPTDTGDVVSTFIENNFGNYISDNFTADMENKLDAIADGKAKYEKTLSDFYKPFHKEIRSKEKLEKITNLGDAPTEFKCPKCENGMIIKLGKTGKFMSCSKLPDCEGARTIEGKELEGPKKTGEKCPDCGGDLVERDGRYGRFISCGNYPKCKFIKADPEEEKKNHTGIKCPTCETGEMVARRGRFGIFYSCSNYPKCKNAIKARPTGNICKMCGNLMMDGTKTIPERCSSNKCPNNRPDKLIPKA